MVFAVLITSTSKMFKQNWITQIFPCLFRSLRTLMELHQYASDHNGSAYKTLFPQITKDDQMYKYNSISLFRLWTGHWRLNSHFFRLGLHSSGLCDQCNIPETENHFITACSKFQSQSAKLRKGTDKPGLHFEITSLLTNKTSIQLIETFLKETGKLS